MGVLEWDPHVGRAVAEYIRKVAPVVKPDDLVVIEWAAKVLGVTQDELLLEGKEPHADDGLS
jgi:hypothetical protein